MGADVTIPPKGFYDRGDPVSIDKTLPDFTTDGAWHDWDLSSIVPAGAKVILLFMGIVDDAIDSKIMFRKKGNSNEKNVAEMSTQVANQHYSQNLVVACDANRIIQYNAENVTWLILNSMVRGWWK